MADICGRPFIEILVSHIALTYRPRSFRFCTGYGADEVLRWVKRYEWAMNFADALVESEPMGTGGALRLLLDWCGDALSEPFLLFNGDTISQMLDTDTLIDRHINSRKLLTVARSGNGSNAGVYVVSHAIKSALHWEARKKFDIEELPIHTGVHVLTGRYTYLDIGTPEGLLEARERYESE
jgi:NDP-sugar pyrophosphorylase family protein